LEELENEEYLTMGELCQRIKFSKQTVYNWIYQSKFSLGVHYLKPSRKKVLFKWSAIKAWLEGDSIQSAVSTTENVETETHHRERAPERAISAINI
jgi:predicted DNA-binding transcriptional regulator AlpA